MHFAFFTWSNMLLKISITLVIFPYRRLCQCVLLHLLSIWDKFAWLLEPLPRPIRSHFHFLVTSASILAFPSSRTTHLIYSHFLWSVPISSSAPSPYNRATLFDGGGAYSPFDVWLHTHIYSSILRYCCRRYWKNNRFPSRVIFLGSWLMTSKIYWGTRLGLGNRVVEIEDETDSAQPRTHANCTFTPSCVLFEDKLPSTSEAPHLQTQNNKHELHYIRFSTPRINRSNILRLLLPKRTTYKHMNNS